MAVRSEELEALGGLATPTADGLDNLLAIMTYCAEEYPTLQAVEAVPGFSALWFAVLVAGAVGARSVR